MPWEQKLQIRLATDYIQANKRQAASIGFGATTLYSYNYRATAP
jgi:hypothetical protein